MVVMWEEQKKKHHSVIIFFNLQIKIIVVKTKNKKKGE